MAKRSTRKLPPGFIEKVRADRATILKDEKPRLLRIGKRMRERHNLLRNTLQALKAEREAQGVSLGELSKRTGISKASLSRLENDPSPNPTIGTLSRIAEALGRQIEINIAPAA